MAPCPSRALTLRPAKDRPASIGDSAAGGSELPASPKDPTVPSSAPAPGHVAKDSWDTRMGKATCGPVLWRDSPRRLVLARGIDPRPSSCPVRPETQAWTPPPGATPSAPWRSRGTPLLPADPSRTALPVISCVTGGGVRAPPSSSPRTPADQKKPPCPPWPATACSARPCCRPLAGPAGAPGCARAMRGLGKAVLGFQLRQKGSLCGSDQVIKTCRRPHTAGSRLGPAWPRSRPAPRAGPRW